MNRVSIGAAYDQQISVLVILHERDNAVVQGTVRAVELDVLAGCGEAVWSWAFAFLGGHGFVIGIETIASRGGGL